MKLPSNAWVETRLFGGFALLPCITFAQKCVVLLLSHAGPTAVTQWPWNCAAELEIVALIQAMAAAFQLGLNAKTFEHMDFRAR